MKLIKNSIDELTIDWSRTKKNLGSSNISKKIKEVQIKGTLSTGIHSILYKLKLSLALETHLV